jgi:guanylate kinase
MTQDQIEDMSKEIRTILQAAYDKIELLQSSMIDLVIVNQTMNRDMMKMQHAIINTHNMLCDLLAKKHD